MFGVSVAWAGQITFKKLSNLTVRSMGKGQYAEINLNFKY